MKEKVLIIGSTKLPIPAVKGGAVPSLIEELLEQNEIDAKINMYCLSLYDNLAHIEAEKYCNTTFIWAKRPKWITLLDTINNFIFKCIFRLKKLSSLSYIWQILWFSIFIAKTLKRDNFDKVIFENSFPVLLSMRLYRNRQKYADKYYIHMHSVPKKYFGNRDIVRNCKRLICISEFVAKSFLSDNKLNIAPNKIFIMKNCIDTNKFCIRNDKEDLHSLYNISTDLKIIMFAGRLCKEKGIVELVKAFKKVEQLGCHLMIVGANFYKSGIISPFEEELHNLCEEIRDKVTFTGYIDYDKMPLYYSGADIIVLPSMWEEPAGMTIVEAMACGKPLITTISGGIPEYTGEGNCIMLERNDVESGIEQAIRVLMSDEKKAKELGLRGNLQAIKYNKVFYYEQLLQLLDC